MTLNCILVDDDSLSTKIIKSFIQQTGFLNLIGEFTDGIEAANFINNSKNRSIDIMFLDIQMPGMTGMELLRTFENLPQIILISGHDNHAIEAFEQGVTDYLLKPVTYPRFLKAVNRAKEEIEAQQQSIVSNSSNHIFIKQAYNLLKIDNDSIFWVEALGDYINIFTDKDKFTVHSTMKNIESKLPKDKFLRVHRSFIVNINKIEKVDLDDGLLVVEKKLIPIGISYKDTLLKTINAI
jgi:DNA-binding LytR/AlgR family response regulator